MTETVRPTVAPARTDVPASKPAQSAAALIDAWFAQTFPNSPVSRNVEVWNFVSAAKDDLKRRFSKEA